VGPVPRSVPERVAERVRHISIQTRQALAFHRLRRMRDRLTKLGLVSDPEVDNVEALADLLKRYGARLKRSYPVSKPRESGAER